MGFRKYQLGSYEEMRAAHRWDVPERYNIARDVCDKHDRDRLAMIWEDWRGSERRGAFGAPPGRPHRSSHMLAATRRGAGGRGAGPHPAPPATAAGLPGAR